MPVHLDVGSLLKRTLGPTNAITHWLELIAKWFSDNLGKRIMGYYQWYKQNKT